MQTLFCWICLLQLAGFKDEWPLSTPETAILSVSTKNRDLWEGPIFWTCAEYYSADYITVNT